VSPVRLRVSAHFAKRRQQKLRGVFLLSWHANMMAQCFEIIVHMRRSEHCGKCGSLKIALRSGKLICPPCRRRYAREYYRNSEFQRARQREYYVLRRYGVKMAELEQLLERQNGCCAICRKHWRLCTPAKHTPYEVVFLHHLCIDHSHEHGEVRGLLCNSCNTAIGLFAEDGIRFVNAMLYLQSTTPG
jgi:hypothetical protein